MAKLESLGKVIETDVLVIGGGSSGMWAANRARELGSNVLVVDKGQREWGGLLGFSGGDMDVVMPEENVDDWVQDLVYYYDGLCDQELMEQIYKQSYDRFQDYVRLGVEFLTGPDGKLRGIPQRGLPHVKLYPTKLKGTGGADMAEVLRKEARRLGVEYLGRTLVTDLLKRDGRVVGAVGFNTINCEFYIFKVGAVILATGRGGWKTGYCSNTNTPEGIYMAFRAGVELKNYEFGHTHNVPKDFAWESQTTLLPLGARFVNAKGEPFMDKYSPLGANTDTHYNCRGMAVEVREGRGPIYFDISVIEPETLEILKPNTGWQKLNYEKLVTKEGMDFFDTKKMLEWMPQFSGIHGAIDADFKGKTTVPGLFVVGVARCLDPGVYMGGFNTMTTSVTGHVAGESVVEYLKSHKPLPIDEEEVQTFKKALYAPLGKVGIHSKEVLTEIQETLFPAEVSLMKNERDLKKALVKMETIRDELLPQMGARDGHYLLKLIEVRAIAFVTELFMRSSLMRTESRAGHYREDYPDRDDKNWLKWIVISQKNGKLNFRTEPVPIDRYKFKPTRYYMDNFTFPKHTVKK